MRVWIDIHLSENFDRLWMFWYYYLDRRMVKWENLILDHYATIFIFRRCSFPILIPFFKRFFYLHIMHKYKKKKSNTGSWWKNTLVCWYAKKGSLTTVIFVFCATARFIPSHFILLLAPNNSQIWYSDFGWIINSTFTDWQPTDLDFAAASVYENAPPTKNAEADAIQDLVTNSISAAVTERL